MKILKSAVLAATLGVFSLPASAIPLTGDSFDIVLTPNLVDNCASFGCAGMSGGRLGSPKCRIFMFGAGITNQRRGDPGK